eukprot:c14767_g1_i1.p1 GENE.c14767_g1_i1~~c14767_g1_i1.p1  ORF type:complete len:388 (+),score=69.50 c14767_g1_i1:34-1197(+)
MDRFAIQDNWLEAVREKTSFWISFYEPGKRRTHSMVHTRTGQWENPDGLILSEYSATSSKFVVSCGASGSPVTVLAPARSHEKMHAFGHVAVDITFGGALGVSGGVAGSLHVWDADGTIKQSLEGHVGDVYTALFFPSGRVVLSTGADTTVRIWNVSDGWCGAVLKGHAGGVLGAAFVERGRNLISCARDGVLKLWDCATSTAIDSISCASAALNSCDVGSLASLPGTQTGSKDEREVGTEGKIAAVASDDGFVAVYDLRARSKVFESRLQSSANAVRFLENGLLAAGTEEGEVVVWDTRMLSSSDPLTSFRASDGPIKSLGSLHSSLVVASAGGECGVFDLTPNGVVVRTELSGVGVDPVTSVSVAGSVVATGARDGAVRLYHTAC